MLARVNDIAREWYVDPGRRAEFKRLMSAHGRIHIPSASNDLTRRA